MTQQMQAQPYVHTSSKHMLLVVAVVLLLLPFVSRHNYILFHTLVELFCVVIAACIFIIIWNTRRFHDNSYLINLGIAFLAITGIALLHALSYQEIAIFPQRGPNLSAQFWIAGHYLQSSGFLVSALLIGKKVRAWYAILFGYAAVAGILITLILLNAFPLCYLEGSGPTLFKKSSEVVIILLFLSSFPILWARRQRFDRTVLILLGAALSLFVASEIALAYSVNAREFLNTLGHLLRFCAFVLVYKAIVDTGLNEPYGLLFFQLKRSEESLRRERDFFSNVIDVAGGLLVVLDTQGRILRFNGACEDLTGYKVEEVYGKPIWDILYPPDEASSIELMISNLRSGIFPSYHESDWITKTGERRCIAWSSTVLQGSDGSIEYMIGTGMDITEQKSNVENLQRLTLLDPLTGLYNRRGFMMFAGQQIKLAERMHRRVLLVFCDIDDMKMINDRYGHLIGDEALLAIAAVFKETFRESDVIGRFGGDEFVVLAVEKSTVNEEEMLARLRDNLATANRATPHPFPLAISIGVAHFRPEEPTSLDHLLEQADAAMYADKHRKQLERTL